MYHSFWTKNKCIEISSLWPSSISKHKKHKSFNGYSYIFFFQEPPNLEPYSADKPWDRLLLLKMYKHVLSEQSEMLVYVNFQHRALANLARAYKNTKNKWMYHLPFGCKKCVWNASMEFHICQWLAFFTTILLLVSINSLTY